MRVNLLMGLELKVGENLGICSYFVLKKDGTGWMDGWVGGWIEAKAGFRIAYSNQQLVKLNCMFGKLKKRIYVITQRCCNKLRFVNDHSVNFTKIAT